MDNICDFVTDLYCFYHECKECKFYNDKLDNDNFDIDDNEMALESFPNDIDLDILPF